MAIRTQKLQAQEAKYDPELIRNESERLFRSCTQAVSGGDHEAFKAQLKVIEEFTDQHQGLHGDIMVMEMLASNQSLPAVWSRMYLDFSLHLLKRLSQNPAEPELWNCLGVCLYELGETKAATVCFSCVERLYPQHSQLRHNKKALRQRSKAGTPSRPFPPEVLASLKGLQAAVKKLSPAAVLPDPASQKLSLVMIVRDEQEMLHECLQSVEGIVDEMIIVDTGSVDDTKLIAQQYGAKVIDFAWTGDFSEARNVSLQNATGDWVIHLDADERLVSDDREKLRPLLAQAFCEGFMLVETNYTGEAGSGAAVVHAPLRIWRNRPHYRFSGTIHEQKTDNMPVYLPVRFQSTDLRLLHYGYLKEMVQSRDKSKRNLNLLLEEARRKETPFNSFNLGNEYSLLGDNLEAYAYYDRAWKELVASGEVYQVGYSAMLSKGLVRCARLSGRTQAAMELCMQALEIFPRHTDLVLEKGHLLMAEGDFEAAAEQASTALLMGEAPADLCGALGSGSFLARALLGEAYQLSGKIQEASEVYRQSLKDDPQYLGSVGSLARCLLMGGAEPEAVADELEDFCYSHPASAGLLVAHSLYERAYVNEARKLYQAALTAQPGSAAALLGLVECALSEGHLQQVIELCQNPSQSEASEALAKSALFACLLDGQLDLASRLIEEGQLDNQHLRAFSAWLELAKSGQMHRLDEQAALALLGMLEAALRLENTEAAEAIIVLASLSALPARQRMELTAQALLTTGYVESAAEAWLEAIDLQGPDSNSLYGLAQIALSQGRQDEALALATDAYSLGPDHLMAARMVAALSEK